MLLNLFSVRARGMGPSAIVIASVVELRKRLESSLFDCLALLLVSYMLGLIIDRGITRVRGILR